VGLENQRQVEGASEVDIYQVVVILREGGLDVSVEDEAGAIDKNVESSKLFDN